MDHKGPHRTAANVFHDFAAARCAEGGREALVLDGGFATNLEEQGYPLHPKLWSGSALLDATGRAATRAAHRTFLDACCDCVITATYQLTPQGMAELRVDPVAAADAFAASVRIALDAGAPMVAASVGPYGAYLADNSEYYGLYGVPSGGPMTCEALMDFHLPRLAALDAAMGRPGPGSRCLFAFETIPCATEAVAIARLLAERFPHRAAWLSFTVRDGQHLVSGESLQDVVTAVEAIAGGQLVALGCNCVSPAVVSAVLRCIRDAPMPDNAPVCYTRHAVVYVRMRL